MREAGAGCGPDVDGSGDWEDNPRGRPGDTQPAGRQRLSGGAECQGAVRRRDHADNHGALRSKYAISDTRIVARWVKKYNGHEDFGQPCAGGRFNMTKGRKTTRDEHIEIVSHCIANSKNYCETIERYGVPYQQIYSWVRKYEACGVDTLLDRRGMRKDKASMSEVENYMRS